MSSERFKRDMDGYAVEYVQGEGWTCDCEDFLFAGSCEHAAEAEALENLERAHAARWAHARGPKQTLQ